MIQKPYYMLDFSASACMFEIRVNDYPVINMNIEGQVSTILPINYAILESGKLNISHIILPLLGETSIHPKAELKYDIKLFDVSNDFVFQKQFGEYKSDPVDESTKLPVITSAKQFTAEVPYKLAAWQEGIEIKEAKEIKEKLLLAYQQISNLINLGKYEDFEQKILNREINMTTSMYLSKTESESRINELIEDFKTGFKVMPIDKNAIFKVYGFGKVFMLKKINGESALYLFNKKTNEELTLDISFYIPKGKTEFEII